MGHAILGKLKANMLFVQVQQWQMFFRLEEHKKF